MPERGFLIFWIFLLFFSKFYCPGRVLTELGTKIFCLFFSLSNPVLANNIAGKRFFNFLIFVLFFFRHFLACVEYERNSEQIFFFFLSLSAYLIPFWLKIMPERGFSIFWFFFYFFSEFSCPGRVWMEFGTKSFFSLSQHISSRFGIKECQKEVFQFFEFFRCFFFGIFLPESSMNGILD